MRTTCVAIDLTRGLSVDEADIEWVHVQGCLMTKGGIVALEDAAAAVDAIGTIQSMGLFTEAADARE